MWSIAPSIVVLGLVAGVALYLALQRPSPSERVAERAAAARMLGIATAIQATHFGEELATGFQVRFPALFGAEPMPLSFFVGFNLAWIVIWIASVPALQMGYKTAMFAAWFLAIAGVLNGIAHPAMAAIANGYFPGLFSSPAIGIAAFVLWRKLRMAVF